MSHPPAWFSAEEVERLLTPALALQSAEAAFRTLVRGEVLHPLRTVLPLPDGRSSFLIMPAASGSPPALGVKLLTLFPGNHHSDPPTPSHQGLLVLFHPSTGAPLALLDAAPVTALRTAAASALATRELALPDADTLALLGSGVQGWSHLTAIHGVRPLREVRVWSPTRAHRERFAREAEERTGIAVRAVDAPEPAVRGASIVCTVSGAREPILKGEWLDPGTHVNAVGASTATTREVDSKTVAQARVYVDLRGAALAEAGDLLIPLREGRIDERHVVGELGEVLEGEAPARSDPGEVTLFISVGLAIQDLAAAEALLALSPPSSF